MTTSNPERICPRGIGFAAALLATCGLASATGQDAAASPKKVEPVRMGLLSKKEAVELSSTGALPLRRNAQALFRFRVPRNWKGSRVGLVLPPSLTSSRGISLERVSVSWSGRVPRAASYPRARVTIHSGKIGRGVATKLDVTPILPPGRSRDLRISLVGGKSPDFPGLPRLVRLPSGLKQKSAASLVATGDIACNPSTPQWNGGRGTKRACRQADVAKLVRPSDDAILLLGDIDQAEGTLTQFLTGFDRSWGHLADRFRPTPGNHEYQTSDADGYFRYFGDLGVETGGKGAGFYSFDLGPWKVLSMNSNCRFVSCQPGSPQEVWFRAELEAARKEGRCTLAFWHHPIASGGNFGDSQRVLGLWQAFHALGGDVLLAAHDHSYQRFGPLDEGALPSGDGPLSWVVGTGGRSLINATARAAGGTESLITGRFGVLRMFLQEESFAWKWVGLSGAQRDSGSAPCRD